VKILIDTACWLWSLTDPDHLNKEARNLLSDPSQALFLSAASSWEIVIKAAIGKLRLPEPHGGIQYQWPPYRAYTRAQGI